MDYPSMHYSSIPLRLTRFQLLLEASHVASLQEVLLVEVALALLRGLLHLSLDALGRFVRIPIHRGLRNLQRGNACQTLRCQARRLNLSAPSHKAIYSSPSSWTSESVVSRDSTSFVPQPQGRKAANPCQKREAHADEFANATQPFHKARRQTTREAAAAFSSKRLYSRRNPLDSILGERNPPSRSFSDRRSPQGRCRCPPSSGASQRKRAQQNLPSLSFSPCQTTRSSRSPETAGAQHLNETTGASDGTFGGTKLRDRYGASSPRCAGRCAPKKIDPLKREWSACGPSTVIVTIKNRNI